MAPLPHAHEHSWLFMSVYGCSWELMSVHESSWVPKSVHKHSLVLWVFMVQNLWLLMASNENLSTLICTYKQQWALMSMAPTTLMSANEHGTMAPFALVLHWHHIHQCTWGSWGGRYFLHDFLGVCVLHQEFPVKKKWSLIALHASYIVFKFGSGE